LERHLAALDRDVARLDADAGRPGAAVVGPDTMADQFTPDRTGDWSDDDLIMAWSELGDDPAAQDQIMDTLDLRQRARAEHDGASTEQAETDHDEPAEQAPVSAVTDASPLTNPVRRAARRLSPEQECRESYDSYIYSAYVAAEDECRGHLLSRDGLAKGIYPVTLFSGPAARARGYASSELRTWWARHGRLTWAEWKWQWFGRPSDRAAALTASHQSLGEVIA
jgi:hypothetical protein